MKVSTIYHLVSLISLAVALVVEICDYRLFFIWESIIVKVKSIIALSRANMGDNRIGSQEIGIESMHRIIVPPLAFTYSLLGDNTNNYPNITAK